METAQTMLVLENRGRRARLDAMRVRFSAHQCLAFDGGSEDRRCLGLLVDYLASLPGLALAVEGDDRLVNYLLKLFPSFSRCVRCLVVETIPPDGRTEWAGFPVTLRQEIPADVQTIFLCDTRTQARQRMRKWLAGAASLIDFDVLPEIALEQLPARAWVPWARDIIYLLDLPDIDFHPGLDILVIDCPARNLGLMPNGLGYVHNALKQVNVRYQTCDLDILLYHRFHMRRLIDEGGTIRLPGGRALPSDPWQAEHYDLWLDPEVIAYFEPEIQEIVDKVVAACPRVLGLSIHSCNEKFSTLVVERVKAALPEVMILVGGFSCYSPDIGLRAFPLADYMCVGEADLTVGPLIDRLARGERPANTPGVLSRFDRPEVPFLPAPMVHDLDLLEHPRYEWYDLDIYRNYNGYQLTPVIASRGCRWSRCTFCAERFYWRIRSPEVFVDELQWLREQGCRLFMFNESDLNGRPEALLAICDEILRRGLRIKLTGQLRIHRKCDRAFYDKLHQAGFVALRFGVDAFSENALRLQKKGYTTADVSQNLKDCWEAGIFTEVNWVIGVPGETDADIEEGIQLILKNQAYIGRLANINPLILSTGSVYWLEPEKHHIHFRGSKEELYRDHPRAIPAHLWYSTEPLIDEKVRKQRFERIVLALHESGFNVGAWANRVIEDVKYNRDGVRTGPREEAGDPPGQQPLSAGVGSIEPADPSPEGNLTFNPDARSSAYVFRAGSSLPEDRVRIFRTDVVIVAQLEELFAIEAAAFEVAFGRLPRASHSSTCRTHDRRQGCKVLLAKTKAAGPELIQSVGTYNIVLYDGLFYGLPQSPGPALEQQIARQVRDLASVPEAVPQQALANELALSWPARGWRRFKRAAKRILPWRAQVLTKRLLLWTGLRKQSATPAPAPGSIPWGDVVLAGLPGVVVGAVLDDVIGEVKTLLNLDSEEGQAASPGWSRHDASRRHPLSLDTVEVATRTEPRLVASLENYNIVEYEGWFYGLPQALGPIDLQQVDVLEMPGVLRDLSREVVEGEIRELVQPLCRS
jgi:radical SAM superfamily enzyme YgiQ (UPF0313 family)